MESSILEVFFAYMINLQNLQTSGNKKFRSIVKKWSWITSLAYIS